MSWQTSLHPKVSFHSQLCLEISGLLFVVGDGAKNNRIGHNYAEFYEDKNKTWTEVEKFPFSVTVDISECFHNVEIRKYQKLWHLIESRGQKNFLILGILLCCSIVQSWKDVIFEYASIYCNESFYIIGGHGQNRKKFNRIAKLEIATWKWSTAGKLNTPRKEHGAIVLDSKFIVVGGPQNKQTEICSLGSGVGKVTTFFGFEYDFIQIQR